MIASANVPPQGKRFRVSRDQMQIGLTIVTTDTFSSDLHLIGNWWQLPIHMITFQSKCVNISQVILTAYHDRVAIWLHTLTRSVVVSYLSQYLQHLLRTSDILNYRFNHSKPFVIVTRYLSQPHPTLQIPRHTCLAPGQFPGLTGQVPGRLLRRAT